MTQAGAGWYKGVSLAKAGDATKTHNGNDAANQIARKIIPRLEFLVWIDYHEMDEWHAESSADRLSANMRDFWLGV